MIVGVKVRRCLRRDGNGLDTRIIMSSISFLIVFVGNMYSSTKEDTFVEHVML